MYTLVTSASLSFHHYNVQSIKIGFLVIVYTAIAPKLRKTHKQQRCLLMNEIMKKNSKHEVVKEIIQENFLELKNLNLQIDTWYLVDK